MAPQEADSEAVTVERLQVQLKDVRDKAKKLIAKKVREYEAQRSELDAKLKDSVQQNILLQEQLSKANEECSSLKESSNRLTLQVESLTERLAEAQQASDGSCPAESSTAKSLEEAEFTVQQLRTKLQSFESISTELADTKTALISTQDLNYELQEQKKGLVLSLSEFESNNQELKATVEELKGKLAIYNQSSDTATEDEVLTALRAECDDLKAKISAANKKSDCLQAQLNSSQEEKQELQSMHAKAMEELRSEMDHIRVKDAEKIEKFQDLQDKLLAKETETKDLATKLGMAHTKSKQLEAETEKLLSVLQTKDAEIDTLAKERDSIKSKAKKTVANFNDKYKKENQTLKEKVEALESELASSHSQFEKQQEEVQQGGASLEDALQDISALKAQLQQANGELAHTSMQLSSVSQEYVDYKKRATSLMDDSRASIARAAELEAKLLQAEKAARSASALEQEVANLNLRINSLQQEKAVQETEAVAEMQAISNLKQQLRSQEESSGAAISQLQRQILSLETQLGDSQDQLSHVQASADRSLSMAKEAHSMDMSELKSSINSLSSENNTLKTQSSALKTKVKLLEQQLEVAKTAAGTATIVSTPQKPPVRDSDSSTAAVSAHSSPSVAQGSHVDNANSQRDIVDDSADFINGIIRLASEEGDGDSSSAIANRSKALSSDAQAHGASGNHEVTGLRRQIDVLRNALEENQESLSLHKRQCEWFKIRFAEMDKHLDANDINYARSVVVKFLETKDPSVIPAIIKALQISKVEADKIAAKWPKWSLGGMLGF